jgi:hypothetical protein
VKAKRGGVDNRRAPACDEGLTESTAAIPLGSRHTPPELVRENTVLAGHATTSAGAATGGGILAGEMRERQIRR